MHLKNFAPAPAQIFCLINCDLEFSSGQALFLIHCCLQFFSAKYTFFSEIVFYFFGKENLLNLKKFVSKIKGAKNNHKQKGANIVVLHLHKIPGAYCTCSAIKKKEQPFCTCRLFQEHTLHLPGIQKGAWLHLGAYRTCIII